MGYKRPSKTYRLRFEDEPGLEVEAKSVPVGDLLEIMRLADQMTSAPKEADVRTLFGWFADRVKSWNLEDEDDQPVPATVDGLLAQDFDFAIKLVLAWVQAVSSVSAPLVTTSTGSTTTDPVEASIPMMTPASPPGT